MPFLVKSGVLFHTYRKVYEVKDAVNEQVSSQSGTISFITAWHTGVSGHQDSESLSPGTAGFYARTHYYFQHYNQTLFTACSRIWDPKRMQHTLRRKNFNRLVHSRKQKLRIHHKQVQAGEVLCSVLLTFAYFDE